MTTTTDRLNALGKPLSDFCAHRDQGVCVWCMPLMFSRLCRETALQDVLKVSGRRHDAYMVSLFRMRLKL